jgi:hypothetical protein
VHEGSESLTIGTIGPDGAAEGRDPPLTLEARGGLSGRVGAAFNRDAGGDMQAALETRRTTERLMALPTVATPTKVSCTAR